MRKFPLRMFSFVFLTLGSVVFLSARDSEVPPMLLRSEAPSLEITTSIRPVTQDTYQLLERVKPGMFRCSVHVTDIEGKEASWATKDIVVGPGKSGEETATLGGLKLHFKATISRTVDRATTEVTLWRDGAVVSRQKNTVWLERADFSFRR